MKTHIVRSQQTDRYSLNVPTHLAELGAAQGTATTELESYASGDSPNLTIANDTLTGLTFNAGGIQILTAGLYLFIITGTWTFAGAGVASIPRSVGYAVNGSSFAGRVDFHSDAPRGTAWDDTASWLVRFAAGDTLFMHVTSAPGFNWDISAKIQIAQIAS